MNGTDTGPGGTAGRGGPREPDAAADLLALFDAWFDEAVRAGLPQPDALALATVGLDGRPAVRMVLLKGFGPDGLVFYTNYHSRKGRELAANPQAAACLWWAALDRQVRISGVVEQLAAGQSDAYFATRPRASQLAAWASPQSEPLADRAMLERRLRELEAEYRGRPIPRPAHWGGYRLVPTEIEFWQGRPHRLHDRLLYRRQTDGTWLCRRLAP